MASVLARSPSLALIYVDLIGSQQLRSGISIHRAGKPIPLDILTAIGLQKGDLFWGLHALGDDIESQVEPQVDNGFADFVVLRVGRQARNKGLIHLQHINGKPVQITQR